jgi:hypothetical protein
MALTITDVALEFAIVAGRSMRVSYGRAGGRSAPNLPAKSVT